MFEVEAKNGQTTLERMYNRFQPSDSLKLKLGGTITPVLSIADYESNLPYVNGDLSITANNWNLIALIPDNETWYVHRLMHDSSAGGKWWVLSNMRATAASIATYTNYRISLQTTSQNILDFGKPLEVRPPNNIFLYSVDGGTTAGIQIFRTVITIEK